MNLLKRLLIGAAVLVLVVALLGTRNGQACRAVAYVVPHPWSTAAHVVIVPKLGVKHGQLCISHTARVGDETRG
jgi:hypothetical protein